MTEPTNKTVITPLNVDQFTFGEWEYKLPSNTNSSYNCSLMGREFDVSIQLEGVSLADVVKHAVIDYKTNWMNNHRPKQGGSKDPVKAQAKYDADMAYLDEVAGTNVVVPATGGTEVSTAAAMRALAALSPEQREAFLARFR